jgi:hypothetical protein
MIANYNKIESSHQWYHEKGYKIPSVIVYGPYPFGDGKNYTNIEVESSNWNGFPPTKTQGTFSDQDMIALRDVLLNLFPLETETVYDFFNDKGFFGDNESEIYEDCLDDLVEAEDDLILDNLTLDDVEDEEAPAYYLEQDPFTDDWVVYELEYQEIASFKSFDHADAYLEMLEAPEEGDDD